MLLKNLHLSSVSLGASHIKQAPAAAPAGTYRHIEREREGRKREETAERERERDIYIYIYIAVELLSGPSLGVLEAIIWSKFVFF